MPKRNSEVRPTFFTCVSFLLLNDSDSLINVINYYRYYRYNQTPLTLSFFFSYIDVSSFFLLFPCFLFTSRFSLARLLFSFVALVSWTCWSSYLLPRNSSDCLSWFSRYSNLLCLLLVSVDLLHISSSLSNQLSILSVDLMILQRLFMIPLKDTLKAYFW